MSFWINLTEINSPEKTSPPYVYRPHDHFWHGAFALILLEVMHYSYFNVSAGLVRTARKACHDMARMATRKAISAAAMNIHRCKDMR